MKKQAFTLVELLVVISIIAVLLAVLVPALSKARESAQKTVCSSRLHSWGISFALYGNDWNSKVCPALMPSGNTYLCWVEALKKYYVDDAIRYCPSANKVLPGSEKAYTGDIAGSTFGAWEILKVQGSYGMNGWAQNPEPGTYTYGMDPKQHWGKITEKGADKIPLLGDCMWREAYALNTDTPIRDSKAGILDRGWQGFGQINRYVLDRHHRSKSYPSQWSDGNCFLFAK